MTYEIIRTPREPGPFDHLFEVTYADILRAHTRAALWIGDEPTQAEVIGWAHAKVERQEHAEYVHTYVDPLLRPVVELHRSVDGYCQGCDVGGFEGEAPPFPCATWELIAETVA